MVLPSICDIKCCFTCVDFGQYGRTNDNSVLRSSCLYKAFEENNFNMQPVAGIEDFENPLPYYLSPW